MGTSSQIRAEEEIERLRQALDAETQCCLELQKRLDRANAEFEEFVSTAAHNLRESLRSVASYSQLMAETCGDSLDSQAGEFLEHIREGAARMQSLLSGVVDYWAEGIGDREFSRTDMEAESGAAVTHDPMPAVAGDFPVLTKVLQHLLRNALEYCDTTSPRVHISSTRADADWVFSVQDNGPGIDPAFRERIFGAFKRLHGKEHPGNGLGLAFCKKAIEWHGGRMWMESTPGAGATFYFSLPLPD
jgi:light-regulated signal transduction histidine kinase (bacteriophytochrome)